MTSRAKEDAARKQAAKDKEAAAKLKQEVRVVGATASPRPVITTLCTLDAMMMTFRHSKLMPTLCTGVLLAVWTDIFMVERVYYTYGTAVGVAAYFLGGPVLHQCACAVLLLCWSSAVFSRV